MIQIPKKPQPVAHWAIVSVDTFNVERVIDDDIPSLDTCQDRLDVLFSLGDAGEVYYATPARYADGEMGTLYEQIMMRACN